MVRLKSWQWGVLALPVASVIGFLLIAAGRQIHQWRLNWIWGIFILLFVGWRWLLVKWTRPMVEELEAITQVTQELEAQIDQIPAGDAAQKAEAALNNVLEATRNDSPVWEDWSTFWQRCQELVAAIAHVYNPDIKYPLLNIYIPQASGLIRGTVDDMDRWMQQLAPILNQVTVGQAYRAYETYRKLEPSARKLRQAWDWAQWFLNPVAAAARVASKPLSSQATQELLANLSQMLREAALRNLAQQAVLLYGGTQLSTTATSQAALPQADTQTLQKILEQAQPVEEVEQKPVSILLAGRTGAGKSSLINTLFEAERAAVDVLPSTDRIQNYLWQTPTGETLSLWDTPGYEQVNHGELRELVLDYARDADLLLLATPALDPALQMDADFLKNIKAEVENLPIFVIVTQVDRLRPIREWEPPYDWQSGDRPKEIAIREATKYRQERLDGFCDRVLPIVTSDLSTERRAWNADTLSLELIAAIAPAKQLRLARFLQAREARTVAAAKIIDRCTFRMTTSQGLASLLKSPVLQFISTLSTGSPTLAYVLAEQIPVEQLPVVIGKLQMAYDLFSLLADDSHTHRFDLLSLWSVLRANPSTPDRNAWAFGHALVEYWTQSLTTEQLQERFDYYLEKA